MAAALVEMARPGTLARQAGAAPASPLQGWPDEYHPRKRGCLPGRPTVAPTAQRRLHEYHPPPRGHRPGRPRAPPEAPPVEGWPDELHSPRGGSLGGRRMTTLKPTPQPTIR